MSASAQRSSQATRSPAALVTAEDEVGAAGHKDEAASPRPDATSVAALRRGLSILDAFSGETEGLGVNEISRKVGVHKSTVSRLCATLETAGYLQRDGVTGRFTLGARLYQLTGSSVDTDLRSAAHPVMRDLVATCGETVSLAVVQGRDVTVIDVVDGLSFVRMQTKVGSRAHIPGSAAAKAILAWMEPADREEMLRDWPTVGLTPDTITDVEEYVRRLDEIRERGYSTDIEELELGLRCVGAAVRDHTGAVVAGISVSGPRHRMTPEVMPLLGRLAKQSADQISVRLGAPPVPPTRSTAS